MLETTDRWVEVALGLDVTVLITVDVRVAVRVDVGVDVTGDVSVDVRVDVDVDVAGTLVNKDSPQDTSHCTPPSKGP